MNKPSILIIEDDKAVKNLIATTLEMHDYHYTWADKGEQGILSAASQRPDIILLDLG
ncbi:response regulator, partial [Clostridioides difficile]